MSEVRQWQLQYFERRKEGRKEGRKEMFLFNDALNTFDLQLYGLGNMVKDHSDRERANLLLQIHRMIFPISSKESFINTIINTGRPLSHQLWSTGWNMC